MESIRQRKIAGLIQREMSMVLQFEGKLIYGDALVTITRVRMTSDLGIARIYVSVYNADYKQGVVKELWDNLYRLKSELSKRIRKQVRRIPLIQFYIDDSLDEADRIGELFSQINNSNSERSMKDAMDAKAMETKAKEDPETE